MHIWESKGEKLENSVAFLQKSRYKYPLKLFLGIRKRKCLWMAIWPTWFIFMIKLLDPWMGGDQQTFPTLTLERLISHIILTVTSGELKNLSRSSDSKIVVHFLYSARRRITTRGSQHPFWEFSLFIYINSLKEDIEHASWRWQMISYLHESVDLCKRKSTPAGSGCVHRKALTGTWCSWYRADQYQFHWYGEL